MRLSAAFIGGNQYSPSAPHPLRTCEYRALPAPGKEFRICSGKVDAQTAPFSPQENGPHSDTRLDVALTVPSGV